MASYLSPEQVDAVALALHCADRGQGFVLADMTGLGKGRVIAARARAVVLSGKPAIFVTAKAKLFSDLWRDIVEIGSADLFGRPFMLNGDAEIVDASSADSTVLHEALDPKVLAGHVRKRTLPNDCKLIMATYSQFNRVGFFVVAVPQGDLQRPPSDLQ